MEINFKGNLSKDDYIKAHKLHSPHKKLRTLLLFLIPLMIIVVIIEFSRNRELSIFLIFIVFFWIYGLLSQRYFIRKFWNQNKVIRENISGTVGDKGIIMSGENWNSNRTWDYFIKCKSSSEMVILYQTFNMMNIFTRSFFENDSDWGSFIEIVKNNVPSK